jgi:ABC-type glycerol-3-phosphate transport system permease component
MKTRKSSTGKTKNIVNAVIANILMILIVFIMLYPVAFAVGASFKPQKEIFSNVLNFFTANPTVESYARAIERID